jgi:hypothetical protein
MSIIQKLEQQIEATDWLISGIDIALERIKELREKLLFNPHPFDSPEAVTFGLDILQSQLRDDKTDLKNQKEAYQKELDSASKRLWNFATG